MLASAWGGLSMGWSHLYRLATPPRQGREHCSIAGNALKVNPLSPSKELPMSLRNNLFASSALMLISLCGTSAIASAADTKPIVHETGAPVARKPLILASFTDALGGRALVLGRTERALAQLNARKSSWSSAS